VWKDDNTNKIKKFKRERKREDLKDPRARLYSLDAVK